MKELAAERKAVGAGLEALLVDAFIFEADAGARSQTIRQTYLDELRLCDVYVGLFWKGYGEYTIDEFEEAQRLRKPCLIYEKQIEIERDRAPELQAFLDGLGGVEDGLTIQRFDTTAELEGFVKRDFSRLLADAFRDRFGRAATSVSTRVSDGIRSCERSRASSLRETFVRCRSKDCPASEKQRWRRLSRRIQTSKATLQTASSGVGSAPKEIRWGCWRIGRSN
jgi:hypothetical protein